MHRVSLVHSFHFKQYYIIPLNSHPFACNFSFQLMHILSKLVSYVYFRLHLAAWAGQTEVVRYLCSNKVDVGATAMDDMGAIHFASQKGHLEVVRLLVSSGVSVKVSNRKGFTPLHYAVKESHMELIKYLIKKGSCLTSKTKAGEIPSDLASNEEVRMFLQEFEKSSKNEDKTENNTNDDQPMQIEAIGEDNVIEKHDIRKKSDDAVGDENVNATLLEPGNGRDKRKSENVENEENEESSIKPKRTKINLDHLLAENDLQEEE